MLAVLLAVLLLAFSAITIGQSAADHKITLGTFNTGAGLMLTLWVIAAVGLVVAWHQPGNPIGWLLLAAPTSLAVTFAGDGYDAAYRAGQHALPVLGPAALIVAQLFFFPFIASRSSSGCSRTAASRQGAGPGCSGSPWRSPCRPSCPCS